MGQFGANDLDNYGSSSSGSFFNLKNDGDVASVRFMYNNLQDVKGYAVHEIEVEGKRKVVNCLREYNEPRDKCPLCNCGNFQRAKLYLPVYDVESGDVKIWERGKKFFPKISAICSRYTNATTPLVAHTFDIERHGKPGDTQTTYEIYETGSDNVTLEDLPDVPNAIGTVVLDKSVDELNYFIDNGKFPSGPVSQSSDMPMGRRTPSNNSGRRGEPF